MGLTPAPAIISGNASQIPWPMEKSLDKSMVPGYTSCPSPYHEPADTAAVEKITAADQPKAAA
jgi:hypothetical protein